MFERETNREKNLEKAIKEAKIKARKEASKADAVKDPITDVSALRLIYFPSRNHRKERVRVPFIGRTTKEGAQVSGKCVYVRSQIN
jgi:hypothetical protein